VTKDKRKAVTPESQLPLAPATFEILLALVGSERHGYAIMKEVSTRTAGAVKLGPGTLSGALKRLLEAGLVEEGGERADPELGDVRMQCVVPRFSETPGAVRSAGPSIGQHNDEIFAELGHRAWRVSPVAR